MVSEAVKFQIRSCFYEFSNTKNSIQIPIPNLQISQHSPKSNIFICKIRKHSQFRKEMATLKLDSKLSYKCLYEGSNSFEEEEILKSLVNLFTIKINDTLLKNIVHKIVKRVHYSEKY